jgi:2-keto-3-deoxy-L-rhamnonate aldolase RhmA
MKGNPMRAGVSRGETQFGTWVNMVHSPSVLTLLKAAGLDFARVDMEHSAFSMETMSSMAALSRALDFPIVVRPPEANREWITRLLDAGVWTIHCPQVDTAAHAAEIVQASRYAPMGSRGMAGLTQAMDFDTSGTEASRAAYANEQVFITVMLESKGAFDHLDEIAAMPGIDALTLGPTDLAQDLGVYGTPAMGPALDERRDMILEAAKKYGKTTAMLVNSYEQAIQWKEAGALLLAYSSDVGVLLDGFKSALKAIKGT